MSTLDKEKWDQRYRDGAYSDRTHPSVLLEEWLPIITGATPGRALDIACGAGRNSVYLASLGYEVDALDISSAGLERASELARERGVEVNWICTDLESTKDKELLPAGPYDLAIMVRYVNMPLIPAIVERLAPGGYLVIEQHQDSDEDVIGPQNADFRVKRNELRNAARDLEIRLYTEGIVIEPDDRKASLARLIAKKG